MQQNHIIWWLKFNGEYDFEYENDNFYPESRDTTIFGKGLCQKVVYLHLYCHNFWNICPKSIKIVFF